MKTGRRILLRSLDATRAGARIAAAWDACGCMMHRPGCDGAPPKAALRLVSLQHCGHPQRQLLHISVQDEEVEKTCEGCGAENVAHSVHHVLRRLPRILALHFKRFRVRRAVICSIFLLIPLLILRLLILFRLIVLLLSLEEWGSAGRYWCPGKQLDLEHLMCSNAMLAAGQMVAVGPATFWLLQDGPLALHHDIMHVCYL